MFGAIALADEPKPLDNRSLGDRARQYLVDLVRLDTSNPPGNETRVADYLKEVADANGIPNELLGTDPKRLNFVARLKGSGRNRPLLLMAHTDVVPADRSQWSVDPFGGEFRNGFIYGRGAWDDKGLLATQLAVLVEIKRRNIRLNRDIILLAEADEEENATGIQWMLQRYPGKIDAEFALGEGGSIIESKDSTKIFRIQINQKVPMRLMLSARGTAGHGAIPRDDNPIVRLSRAVVKLTEAEQPARLGMTMRRYLRELAKLPDYSWLVPILPRLEDPSTLQAAAAQIRTHDSELDSLLRTTISPTVVRAGGRNNVIPNAAEAQVDVQRLPGESREEVIYRIRQIINDAAIEVSFAPGTQSPGAEPSPLGTTLYRAIERAIGHAYPHDVVVPYIGRVGTDAAHLRTRGIPVYGAPIFIRELESNRAHTNDERITPKNLNDGAGLLWQVVLETAGAN
ncbi:MAG: M20/M25/M40 family metallo-hydrolase [Bryobacteraceae bacterium]